MIVYNYYPHDETRVERQAVALRSAGYAVDVICLRQPSESRRAVEAGVTVHRVPLRKLRGPIAAQLCSYLAFFVMAFTRVGVLHLRRPFAAVQVHNLPDFLVFAALVPRLRGARVLLDLHDLMPEFFASRFGAGSRAGRLAVRVLRWQERAACRFADHVVTVTEPWKRTLVARGTPSTKVSVVMNTPDTAHFRHRDPAPAAPGHEFHLLYHGTLVRRYGIDLAVRAVHLLRDEIPGLRLTIHGSGDAAEELRQLSHELRLGGSVTFSNGFLPTAEMAELVRGADLAVVPYRRDVFTDGILPTKLMEYVASGVPVVCTRTPVIETYFDESMLAFVDSEDPDGLAAAVRGLYHDRPGLRALAAAASSFTERHDWATTGSSDYVQLVDGLTGPDRVAVPGR